MEKSLPGEVWKKIDFKKDLPSSNVLEISNLGRLRSFNKTSDGNIIQGSMVNGYRIVRLKLFAARDEKTTEELEYLKNQVDILSKKITASNHAAKGKPLADPDAAIYKTAEELEQAKELLAGLKSNYSKKILKDTKSRATHYHALIHRLVAEYFLIKPSEKHTVVAHIDYDKLNNHRGNLKWMTVEENYEHQKKSPLVMASKGFGEDRRKEDSKATKLTTTKVMLLKKLLNEGKPMRSLVKQFKVTETQILRIKRGENWKDVQAAK